jgi:hypothetical protein
LTPAGEALNGGFEVGFEPGEPVIRIFVREADRFAQGSHHRIDMKLVGVSLGQPLSSALFQKGRLEGVELADVGEVAFEVGDVGMIGAEAELLIEDPEEDPGG